MATFILPQDKLWQIQQVKKQYNGGWCILWWAVGMAWAEKSKSRTVVYSERSNVDVDTIADLELV